jgi:hypothetical protein
MTSTHTQEEATAPPQGAPIDNGPAQDRASLITLAIETLSLGRRFFELLILELRLAAQSIPKIIFLSLAALLLTVFAWLSFAATIAWISAIVFHSTGWGIFAFLILQLAALLVCAQLIRRYSRRLTLPNSRGFLKQLEDTFHASDR